jgi:predicted short-subunit dehydrogenase-like oxidoreductase (DUF2520 family)
MKVSDKRIERKSPQRSAHSGKFRVAIIGAGRMGTTLGRALYGLGYPINLAVTKHASSARRAAKLLKTEVLTMSQISRSESARERLFGASFLLISTPDDALESVVSQLAGLFRSPPLRDRKVAVHTSGALSSKVLKPLRAAGFAVASLHPLVSVADAASTQDMFQGAYFCIEGDREAVRAARTVVRQLGALSFTIDANAKTLYHAAAVMSSGHVTALFDLAVEILKRSGLPPRRARAVLLPLLASTTANLESRDSAHALTGPFARGDVKTAAKHLAALKSDAADDALAAYIVLGRRSLKLARTLEKHPQAFHQMSRLLSRSRK